MAEKVYAKYLGTVRDVLDADGKPTGERLPDRFLTGWPARDLTEEDVLQGDDVARRRLATNTGVFEVPESFAKQYPPEIDSQSIAADALARAAASARTTAAPVPRPAASGAKTSS